jgi:MFS family permease
MQIACLFLCRFGLTMAFNLSYTIMRELFPTLVRATSFGICNVCARLLTISAPVIATAHFPLPMFIVAGFSGIAAALTVLLRPLEEVEA